MNFLVSIVVPVKKIGNYLRKETIPALLRQSHQNFEIIILPDKPTKEKFLKTKIIPTWPKTGPADKRDIGAQKAKGEILAFIDDDAYPDKDWLKNALLAVNRQAVAAVCGPGVTPPNDPFLAQISGWMWSSFLGSGGAGQYRCWSGERREVDDFPTFNLIVKRSDFKKVGGFDSRFWSGEDTKLCHDLVYKLKKKIIYDPKVLVYHHRRKIFIPHLKQIGRYGLHRGFFAKILPKTSRKIGYFLPLLFTAGVLLGPAIYLISFILKSFLLAEIIAIVYLSVVGIYSLGLLLTGFWVFLKSKDLLIAILVIPTIFISHLFYGIMFFKGLIKKIVKSKFGREKI